MTGPDAAALEGSTFTSTQVQGHDLVAGTSITLTFEDGRMVATAGCNTMSGSYDVSGGTLAWTGPAASTMMGCPDDLAAQDQWISGLLTDGMSAELDESVLVLGSGDVTIRLAATAPADLSSVLGTTWTLTTIIDGDTASSVPLDPAPSVEVAQDGTASVDTGCNRGRTTVTVTGDTLDFGPMALTRKACPGARGKTEKAVVAVLDGTADRVEWDGTVLTVTKGERGVGFEVR